MNTFKTISFAMCLPVLMAMALVAFSMFTMIGYLPIWQIMLH